MKDRTKAGPGTIAAMIVGLVVCIVFIVHSLPDLMGSNTPPKAPPANAGQPASASAPPAPGAISTAPQNSPLMSRAPAQAPATAPSGGPMIAGDSEADLSPYSDPFETFPGEKGLPVPDKTVAVNTRQSGPTVNPLAGFGTPQKGGSVPVMQVVLKEPLLVGTLLGDRPSGVFKVDEHILTVAEGGDVIGWKVVSVRQGEAVLRGMGKTLRLATGMPATSIAAAGEAVPDPASPTSAGQVTAVPTAASPGGHITVTESDVPAGSQEFTTPSAGISARHSVDPQTQPDSATANHSIARANPVRDPARTPVRPPSHQPAMLPVKPTVLEEHGRVVLAHAVKQVDPTPVARPAARHRLTHAHAAAHHHRRALRHKHRRHARHHHRYRQHAVSVPTVLQHVCYFSRPYSGASARAEL